MNNPKDAVRSMTTDAKLLIDGEFLTSKSTEWREIMNPATQEVIGRAPYATAAEVEAAIHSAHAASARYAPICCGFKWMREATCPFCYL